MRRKLLLSAMLNFVLVAPLPARADFKLGPSPADASTVVGQPASAPPASRSAGEPASAGSSAAGSRFKIARGFGRGIQLDFAARQIVPPSIVVRYGPGVDRTLLVNWSGNAPWHWVLDAAVRPLGLHILTGVQTVLISR